MLNAHLEKCAECSSVFAEMSELHANWLPECPGFEIHRDQQSDLRHRDAILKRISREGAHFSRAARSTPSSDGAGAAQWFQVRGWVALAAGIVMFCLGVGLVAQQAWYRPGLAPMRAALTIPAAPAPIVSHGAVPPRPAEADLERQIEEAKGVQSRLREQLASEEHKAALLGKDHADAVATIADLTRQLDAADATQHQAETELASVRSKQATTDAITIAQQAEIQSLNQKLSEKSARDQNERRFALASEDVRSLISARNLHIIDVYDTDSKGKTSAAFGRIFYTEGKSLVFYAYDLNGKRSDAGTYAFYVWGKRDADPQQIKNLGALAMDNQGQRRWIFSITDPKVLGSIDSLFVTLESAQVPADQPKGKRFLTAFLGTPANHP